MQVVLTTYFAGGQHRANENIFCDDWLWLEWETHKKLHAWKSNINCMNDSKANKIHTIAFLF